MRRQHLRVPALCVLTLCLVLVPPGATHASHTWQTYDSVGALSDALGEAPPGSRLQLRGSHDPLKPKAFNDAYLVAEGVRGTSTRPIRLRMEPGTYGYLTTPAERDYEPALIRLTNCSHLQVSGFVLREHAAPTLADDAIGVHITANQGGSSRGIELTGLTLLGMKAFYAPESERGAIPSSRAGNAHGILVAARHEDARIEGVAIRGCALRDLRLGSSEALSINGNVLGFLVAGNVIEGCDNIGIDAIGGYHAPGSTWDRARRGRIVGNIVRSCSSVSNPAYGGVRAAAGIYIDGAHLVTVVDNLVIDCDHGLEVGCEERGHLCTSTVLRGNRVRDCHVAALVLGSNGRDYDKALETQPRHPTTGRVSGVEVLENRFAARAQGAMGSLIELLRVEGVRFRGCTFVLPAQDASLLGQHLSDAPCSGLDVDETNRVEGPWANEATTIRVRFSRDGRLPHPTLPPAPKDQTYEGLRTWVRTTARALSWRLAPLPVSALEK